MRRLLVTLLALCTLALVGVGAAAADGGTPISMQPLIDAGYSVGVASQLDATCTVWDISGHGVSEQVNDCDPAAAATVASLTDPNLIFEADWQMNHPDQLAAAQAIAVLCYSISRTAPMTDSWRVVGGDSDVTVTGDGLPQLAGSLPSVCGQGPPPVVGIAPGSDGSGTTTEPGAPTVVKAIDQNATAIQTAKLAANVTPQQVDAASVQGASDASSTGDPAIVALAARSAAMDVLYGIDPSAG